MTSTLPVKLKNILNPPAQCIYQLQVTRDAIKIEGPLYFDLRDSVDRNFQQAINTQRILV